MLHQIDIYQKTVDSYLCLDRIVFVLVEELFFFVVRLGLQVVPCNGQIVQGLVNSGGAFWITLFQIAERLRLEIPSPTRSGAFC